MNTPVPRQGHSGTGRVAEGFRAGRPSPGRPCRERPLDAVANFAAMATFTTSETPEPVPLELAESGRARRRGLLGRDGIEGALLLTPASSVHTFGMRFAIDVAYLDGKARVRAVRTMRPGRVGLPAPGCGRSWRRRPGRWRGGVCGGAYGSRSGPTTRHRRTAEQERDARSRVRRGRQGTAQAPPLRGTARATLLTRITFT